MVCGVHARPFGSVVLPTGAIRTETWASTMAITLLERSIDVLKELRSSMHGDVDASALEQLDDVIRMLEQLERSGTFDSDERKRVLRAIGAVLARFPQIDLLIQRVTEWLR